MAVKRTAAKKAPARKTVAKRAPAKKKAIAAPPAGYSRNPRGTLLVPSGKAKGSITPASKLRAGIAKAQDEIKDSLQEIATLMTMDFEVAEIELSISFSADGKFLGFGVGGATSIKVKIKPIESKGEDSE